MNDMIGCSGMLGGWTTLWHTDLIYMVPLFAVSVAAIALAEFLSTVSLADGVRLVAMRRAASYAYGLIPLRTATMNRDAMTAAAVRLDLPGNTPLS